MATFESQNRRMPKIEACLKANGLESLDACNEMLLAKGIDCDKIIRGIQPICFDNAVWAYTLGTAIAVKRGLKSAADCAAAIGEGLEAFTIPGSVAEQRKVGLGHGNLGAMLLHEDTHCFAFLAGHESFAAAEGAIGIARTANKVRKEPLRVILNGLGKDAAQIISRINGFTYVKTDYDFATGELKVVETIPYSDGERAAVKCYGANDVLEGVAIMKAEGVEVSITGNSTNPTRFQHLVAGTYHELNEMEKSFKRIKNYNVSVKEIDNKVIFLRKLERGGSEHSFGIHVAKMAGMPKSIVKRANDILKQLETDNRQQGISSKPMVEVGETRGGMQLSFFQLDDPVLCQIRDEILNLDVNNLTPLEALNKLNDIKRIVKGK